MANLVRNILSIEFPTAAERENFLLRHYSEETLDFNRIVPVPKTLISKGESLSDAEHDWRVEHWGTRSGPVDSSYLCDNGCGVIFAFSTANGAPTPIVKKLSELYPKADFTLEYANEDLGRNCGTSVYKNGEEILELQDEDPFVFACSVWGLNPEKVKEEQIGS